MAEQTREEFLRALDTTFVERAVALIWWTQSRDSSASLTVAKINTALIEAGFAGQNVTRLRQALTRDRRTIKSSRRLGGFQIRAQSRGQLNAAYASLASSEYLFVPPQPLRILFASSDPEGVIRAESEQRAVQEALERSRLKDHVTMQFLFGASYESLSRRLHGGVFDLVHISSHGAVDGVQLDGQIISPEDLADMFSEHVSRSLYCVLLNACWSSEILEVPKSERIPLMICMNGEVGSHAARVFSEGFYDTLAIHFDYAAAFREGRRRANALAAGDPFDVVAFAHGRLAEDGETEPNQE